MTGDMFKTSYDVLIDSLIKYSLIRPWTSITSRRVTGECSREELRGLLACTLSHLCREGWESIINSNSWLTPENSEDVHVRAT